MGAILTVAELVIEAVVEEVKLWLIGLLVDCSNEYPESTNRMMWLTNGGK